MIDLNIDQKSELAETFGLLSDPTRLSVVLACIDIEISAGDIANKLGISPSLVSQHLRLLRSAGIVRSERKGKRVFCTMTDNCIRDVLATMIDHLFVHKHSKIEGETL